VVFFDILLYYYHSLFGLSAKSNITSPSMWFKTIIPMGIIHLSSDEHHVFILTEGGCKDLWPELYFIYLLWLFRINQHVYVVSF